MKIRIANSEVAILLIVSLMSFGANLPDGVLGNLVDRNLLLVSLVATVFISLFRYLRFMLFLTISVLAIGANLPEQLAHQLHISQGAMIVASGVLVCFALLYKVYDSRLRRMDGTVQQQSEISASDAIDTLETRIAVISAIHSGDFSALHQLLNSGVDVNFRQNGEIPLFLAIEEGYPDLVLLLIAHGAKLKVRNKEGKAPIEFALLCEQLRIAKMINYASQRNLTLPNTAVFPSIQKTKLVILFADICGSTALYDKLGNDAALQVITRTLGILAKVVATHKGSLIKTIGDEIMCSFPNINLAIQAAGTMHKAIEQLQPGGKDSIHVRIGFHYGEVICKENDIFGDAVNIASRVTAVTRSRQIMTTKAVVDLLPAGLLDRVRPVMRAAFRGKQDSFAVFQILWEAKDSSSARVGQSSWRAAESNQNETSSGDQTSQPTAVRFTSTLILDKPFDSLPGAILERLTH